MSTNIEDIEDIGYKINKIEQLIERFENKQKRSAPSSSRKSTYNSLFVQPPPSSSRKSTYKSLSVPPSSSSSRKSTYKSLSVPPPSSSRVVKNENENVLKV